MLKKTCTGALASLELRAFGCRQAGAGPTGVSSCRWWHWWAVPSSLLLPRATLAHPSASFDDPTQHRVGGCAACCQASAQHTARASHSSLYQTGTGCALGCSNQLQLVEASLLASQAAGGSSAVHVATRE